MIISASRRTDIPAFFSDWFLKRIEEGYVYVRNPMNARQVSKISLAPEVVDCIVFWSKNPAPMMEKLGRLEGYAHYFQFTLNAYGRDMEARLWTRGWIHSGGCRSGWAGTGSYGGMTLSS